MISKSVFHICTTAGVRNYRVRSHVVVEAVKGVWYLKTANTISAGGVAKKGVWYLITVNTITGGRVAEKGVCDI